ncbi:MAG: hypothetical protein FJ296_01360 [Planctomycetes bacterium]|nr:hypothetical protein [Planctomycetota bacterium]
MFFLLLVAAALVPDARASTTRNYFTRPVALAPDLNARGSLTVRSKSAGASECFEVRLRKMDPDLPLSVRVADGDDEFGGWLAPLPDGAARKLVLDTSKGDELPFGESLSDLAGRRVQIVDDNDTVVLETVLPTILDAPVGAVLTEVMNKNPDSDFKQANGTVRFINKPKSGKQFIRVRVGGISFKSKSFSLWVEDDAEQMVKVAPIDKSGKNQGMYRAYTRYGDPLPLGVPYLADLSEREIQVRADQPHPDGELLLTEQVPLME